MKYDLIVIGGGSGGVACSRRCAALGAKVAIVEYSRLGGTCVIRGCVPKKLLMYAGGFLEAFNDATSYGWKNLTKSESGNKFQFDMKIWQENKTKELIRLEKIYENLLSESGVEIFKGKATIVSENKVEINGKKLTTSRIMIATGGKPAIHSIPGLKDCMTSNEILELTYIPKKLAILGSGYIALEFACIFNKLGSEVSIFFRSDYPLRGFDLDIRKKISTIMKNTNIRLFSLSKIQSINKIDGQFTLEVNNIKYSFSEILNALGRNPNTQSLGLNKLGMKLGDKDEILVDKYNRTSIKNIFAIGDVTNRLNLTPVAIAEGRAFAENEFNNKNLTIEYDSIASAVFTTPSIGTIGMTEEQAKIISPERKFHIFETEFKPMRKTFTQSKIKTFIKIIVDARTDIITGIHMIGSEAPELIQILSILFKIKATKYDFDNTIAVHPTSAEEFVLLRKISRTI
ncbi:MAG: glutathione-disulfide reductase [Betaproteobacteria bacterium TMED156]|nr:MAG: glutathione-disulfide reductase [Betaproteobacteria bacterium TMED156]